MQLYYFPMSTGCQSVQVTAKAVGVELELMEVDITAGAQMNDEFVAINPRHIVPTLVDDDFVLCESRAICRYLVNQYAEEDTLYPKDPKTRAMIDSLLDFDLGTLHDRFVKYSYPIYKGDSEPDAEALAKIHKALGFLNGYLSDCDYVTGDQLTIADIALVATTNMIRECGLDFDEYVNVLTWLEKCRENINDFEGVIGAGSKMVGDIFKSKLE